GADEDSVRLIDLVKDGSEDPSELVENEEIKAILAESIDALPERERLIISLYHYEGLTLREIGATLDISESRVSQIHTKAILRLRSRLARFKIF
ncbi:MAG TPA: FliA/WhiG family RNA polymerase sigma factor, partial [Firmicutes bacterium]|nr:FliA/WhiG family RNA polymerase sigma factor [Bacillota bacterium]HCM17260.1 FliA/WhiG family RNA polymerase sigma factor [Bacillota bacterium]